MERKTLVGIKARAEGKPNSDVLLFCLLGAAAPTERRVRGDPWISRIVRLAVLLGGAVAVSLALLLGLPQPLVAATRGCSGERPLGDPTPRPEKCSPSRSRPPGPQARWEEVDRLWGLRTLAFWANGPAARRRCRRRMKHEGQRADRHIVVGVDGSLVARSAVLWAAREARLRQCDLIITHIDPPQMDAVGLDRGGSTHSALLDDSVPRPPEASRHHLSTRLLDGSNSDELIRATETAVLLVLGIDRDKERAATVRWGLSRTGSRYTRTALWWSSHDSPTATQPPGRSSWAGSTQCLPGGPSTPQ